MCTNIEVEYYCKYSCSPNSGEGYILFLMWSLLALVSALALAFYFLVCTISCEPVVGFLPNLHGYIIGT